MKIFDGQKGKHSDEAEYLTYTHKRCPTCDQVKAVELFYRRKSRTRRGWSWDTYCIECCRAACAEYGRNSREKRNARLRSWRARNPTTAKAKDRRQALRRNYGLKDTEVAAMRELQGGLCALCDKAKPLCVDHCHTTGKVRALLCNACNIDLGWYESRVDRLERFQRYVERYA